MKTFKVLGLLLSYPQPDWLRHLGACRDILEEERLLTGRSLARVLAFIETLESRDVYALQEEYVATFDRGRAHSLHLFEHIHGESRDRGQAMVNLAEAYAGKGLVIDRPELPDYLPLFLEFLSCCAPNEAIELLGEPVEVIAAIGQRLGEKESPYAPVFEALAALSRTRPRKEWLDTLLAATPADESLAELDREWEEAAAFSGPPAQPGCQDCPSHRDGLNLRVTR